MATLQAIFEQINIYPIKVNDIEHRDYYDVDIYEEGKKILQNVLYISDIDVSNIENGSFIVFDEDMVNKKCNYVLIDKKENSFDIFKKIHSYFLSYRKAEQSILFLFKNLTGDKNIEEIITVAARLIDNPIILTNTDYKVLAMNDNGYAIDDPIWLYAKEYGYCSDKDISQFELQGVTKEVLNADKPFLHKTGISKNIPRILGKVTVKGEVVAYIGVFQISHAFTKNDYDVVENLCRIIHNLIKNDSSLINNSKIDQDTLLSDLLNKRISNDFELLDRLKKLNWIRKPRMRISAIHSSDTNERIENSKYLMTDIETTIGAKAMISDKNIIVLHEYESIDEYERQIDSLEKEAKQFKLKIGVSDEFNNLLDLSKYNSEARKALEIALTLKAKDTVFYFSDLLPYYLISCCTKSELDDCSNIYYEKLNEYDKKHKTDYCMTLYYYVLFNCSLNNCAIKLNLHRNSLSYRIEKITEISGIDLSNGVLLQNYVLYYQIMAYLSKVE